MKYFAKHFFTGLMILALTSAVAFGKVRRESITLGSDTMIAGTMVKAGTYDVKFDDKTSELSIMKEESNKVIVKTTGQLKARATKSHGTQYEIVDNALVSVAFNGQTQDVVIGQSSTTTEQ
jgi:hypothetical protein